MVCFPDFTSVYSFTLEDFQHKTYEYLFYKIMMFFTSSNFWNLQYEKRQLTPWDFRCVVNSCTHYSVKLMGLILVFRLKWHILDRCIDTLFVLSQKKPHCKRVPRYHLTHKMTNKLHHYPVKLHLRRICHISFTKCQMRFTVTQSDKHASVEASQDNCEAYLSFIESNDTLPRTSFTVLLQGL
jgi:hypothetical protein